MERNLIRWDVDELERHNADVMQKRDELRSERDFLVNLNELINEAWQGLAGSTFDQVMEIDINNYDMLISELDALTEDLQKVSRECYEPCEEDIKALVRTLRCKLR